MCRAEPVRNVHTLFVFQFLSRIPSDIHETFCPDVCVSACVAVSLRVNNDYENNTNGDDEDVYENVDPVHTKKPKEEAGRVEEEYYDDGVSEINNDEETSDNEDDYENVTQRLVEAAVDIYGGDEDIYQNF